MLGYECERRQGRQAHKPVSVSQRWRSSTGLVWVQFPDSPHWVVYSSESADVHLLTDAAHALWTRVQEVPGTSTEQLLTNPVGRADATVEETSRAVLDTITFMDRAGLVLPQGD